jgi:hypothetical protein
VLHKQHRCSFNLHGMQCEVLACCHACRSLIVTAACKPSSPLAQACVHYLLLCCACRKLAAGITGGVISHPGFEDRFFGHVSMPLLAVYTCCSTCTAHEALHVTHGVIHGRYKSQAAVCSYVQRTLSQVKVLRTREHTDAWLFTCRSTCTAHKPFARDACSCDALLSR